jgi:hypothetical protein
MRPPPNSTTAVTSSAANGVWFANAAGLKYVRARVSAYTSGTVVVTIQAALSGGGSGGGGGGGGSGPSGTIGAAVPATASPAAVKDNAGNLAYPNLDASGNLLVAVTGAGSGGTSSVDGAGYTAGTTAGTPTMGARDDVGTTACAEDKVCIARLTSSRALMVDLSGTAANGTAIKVDGSAVTQPVSGTVTTTPPANASTNVAQFGGTNVSTGTGVGGAGIPRVTVSSDSSITANAGTNLNTSALLLDATYTGRMPAGASPANGESNTNTALSRIGAFNFVFNGATWDRWTGGVTQSGTWTVQPGNTANTTPWLMTISQGGNAATVSAAGALKVDGSAVTQPVSGTVSITANSSVNVAQLAGTTTDTNSGAEVCRDAPGRARD